MFRVVKYVGVLDLSYIFPIVIDMILVDMFRSQNPVISNSYFHASFPLQEQEQLGDFLDRSRPLPHLQHDDDEMMMIRTLWIKDGWYR